MHVHVHVFRHSLVYCTESMFIECDVDVRTKPVLELTRPASSSISQAKLDQKGNIWRKPSFDQTTGVCLDIYKEIHPKKSNESAGIINNHAKLKLVHDDSPKAHKTQ